MSDFVPQMPEPPEAKLYWARPRGSRKWRIFEYMEAFEALNEPAEWFELGSETPIEGFADLYELGDPIVPPDEQSGCWTTHPDGRPAIVGTFRDVHVARPGTFSCGINLVGAKWL